MTVPRWKRGDLTDRIGNHCSAEAVYQRQVGDIEQIVERIYIRGDETNAYRRPNYRLVEVRGAQAPRIVFIDDTLKSVRARADRRAS